MAGPAADRRARRYDRGEPETDASGQRIPRIFVAVPLPEEARLQVADLVARVRAEGEARARPGAREARWVRAESLHVTLRFLGPTEAARVPDVEAAIAATVANETPFPVTLAGAGAFPSAARPRVLWLGIRTGADDLARLAERLGQELNAAGWALEDRPFRAHLTLARTDGVRGSDKTARSLAAEATDFESTWTAESVVLFESITGHGPARYERLATERMQGERKTG